ncbi:MULTISPECIES: phosphoribosylformylglycinamidine synthase-associated small membrane protein [unclassified Roseibium]
MDEDTRKAITLLAVKAAVFILVPALAAFIAVIVLL